MQLFHFAFAASSLLLINGASAQDVCDAELIKQLRTTYSISQTNNASEALHEAACHSNSNTNKVGLSLSNPEYGDLSFSSDDGGLQKACWDKNYKYFDDNKYNLAYSFLPESAFMLLSQTCGGARLSVTAQVSDDIVLIRAAFHNNTGSGQLAYLKKDIQVFPADGAACKPITFKKGLTIIPGGRTQACKRTGNKSVYFLVHTDQGDETVGVARTPVIRYVPYIWSYDLSSDSANIRCRNQEGPAGNYVVGGMGGTGQAAVERVIGYCVTNYGIGYYTVDNTPQQPLRPSWSFQNPAGSEIDCSADQVKLPPISCQNYGVCSSPQDNPQRVVENTRFWCAGHFYAQIEPTK